MPDSPTYCVSLCEGDRCVPLPSLDDTPATIAALLPFLRALTQRLRKKGAMGRVEVTNGRDGTVVATRSVWP